MKISCTVILLLSVILLLADTAGTSDRIKKYSGRNSDGLIELYSQTENGEYIKFILDNSSPNDLAVLTPEMITSNVALALKTKEFKYSSLYGEDIFKHFVLPGRITQEPYENWREKFYKEISPLVKDISDIEEAAIIVNLWCLEKMTYKPTHGKDQGPLTTIKRGYGRCEEMMIIYMAAARSVGIPVRSAGTSLWNFTDSNHAWIEVWTPSGWKYLGEPADQLNSTWFTKTTERASMITSMAFGSYNEPDMIEQKDNSTEISSIRYYTDQWDDCTVTVKDDKGQPVEDAEVMFYAVSWGGIFPMQELKTGEDGKVKIQLGRGSVFAGAYEKDTGFAGSMFNTLEGSKDITLTLMPGGKIGSEDLYFKFQPVSESVKKDSAVKKYFEGRFSLMNENSNLKRNQRLNNFKKTAEFAEYYLKGKEFEDKDDFYSAQNEFLKKCEILGGNTAEFLKAFKSIDNDELKDKKLKYKILIDIIEIWDDKELCEIPDSAVIKDLTDILYEGRKYYKKIPDSVFVQNVVAPTWQGGQVVQSGWQKEFYGLVKDLRNSNIKKTAEEVIKWADSKVSVDSNFVYHYYSCPLNPLEIINMNSVPDFFRLKLIDSALKILGIPTRWKGEFEYYNGKGFVVLEPESGKKEAAVIENTVKLSLYADGKQIKAEPWGNFQVSEFIDGELNYYYFDGRNDSLDFIITYPGNKEKELYIQAGIRNTNGDANIAVRPLSQSEGTIRIDLTTPRENFDISGSLGADEQKAVSEILLGLDLAGSKILLIRGSVQNEPTNRMTSLLTEKYAQYKDNGADLIIYTEVRDDNDLNTESGIIKKKGGKLISSIGEENYPVIAVSDPSGSIIFVSKGYNMNIGDVILMKVKKN